MLVLKFKKKRAGLDGEEFIALDCRVVLTFSIDQDKQKDHEPKQEERSVLILLIERFEFQLSHEGFSMPIN